MPSTTCGYCAHITHMSPHDQQANVLDLGGALYLTEASFRCDNCGRLSLAIGQSFGDPNDGSPDHRFGWANGKQSLSWLPKVGVGQDYPDVPEHIASAASEAHECQSIRAHRAAILLARSVVEATAKHHGITSGTLYGKIDALAEKSILREHVKEQAHEIRVLGNEMAHGDFVQPVSAEDADEVLALMAEVLHEAFQSEAKLQRRRAARVARSTQSNPTEQPDQQSAPQRGPSSRGLGRRP